MSSYIFDFVFNTEAAPGTTNKAGGLAYESSPEHALAQYSITGCFGDTFYASAKEQLDSVLALARQCDPEFVAKCAIYAREKGRLKDMPAFLCAYLSLKDPVLFRKVFKRVVRNGRMLRTFVKIMRSGAVGRKSLGYAPKRMVQEFLRERNDDQIFYDSVGNDPSLADIVKMVHPKPNSSSRSSLYSYLIGKNSDPNNLPRKVIDFEKAKKIEGQDFPDVNFQMLTSAGLTKKQWCQVARVASWTMTRMNINTFARHGVFEDVELVLQIAARLKDKNLLEKVRPLPYEIMVALANIVPKTPLLIVEALNSVLEHSLINVPEIEGDIYICVDTSGSMSSPITGGTGAVTSEVDCIDVASLFAAALLRKNKQAQVIPFDTEVHHCRLDPNDSLAANTKILSSRYGGGGTSCSAPLKNLNNRGTCNAKAVIYISDNESWADIRSQHTILHQAYTAMGEEWILFKSRNTECKLVCIDLTPNMTTQVTNSKDRLNVAGFSDAVFEIVAEFINDGFDGSRFVEKINQISIDGNS